MFFLDVVGFLLLFFLDFFEFCVEKKVDLEFKMNICVLSNTTITHMFGKIYLHKKR